MEGQIEVPEAHPAAQNNRCNAGACNEPATADLDAHPLCLQHFVSGCLRELDARSENVKGQSFDAAAVNDLKHFLAACEREAKRLSQAEEIDDSQMKPRILEVLRRVSQLSRGLRRSPRFATSVPVWLRREDPSRTWEEETWTSSVSRYGAGFSCHHPVDTGGEVVLCRRDKGNRVRARVVYSRFDNEGRRQIGVELLDQIDFWELEKIPGAPISHDSPQ